MNRTVTEDDPSHPSASNHLISVGSRKVQRVFFSQRPLEEKVRAELSTACRTSPLEICGFITDRQEIHYVENVHEFPSMNFYMDNAEGAQTIRHIYQYKKDKVLGIFHTHPNGVVWPSPRDIVGWPNPELGWRYFIATPRDIVEWALV